MRLGRQLIQADQCVENMLETLGTHLSVLVKWTKVQVKTPGSLGVFLGMLAGSLVM